MTKKESQEFIVKLDGIVQDFKTFVSNSERGLSEKIEQNDKLVKTAPINLELGILSTCQTSIDEAIKTVLTQYNSPLFKLIEKVLENNSEELIELIDDSFKEVIRTDDFKRSIVSAFSHKISRSIISNNNGLFDKVSNELKSSPEFKSRMVLAVAAVVEECMTKN